MRKDLGVTADSLHGVEAVFALGRILDVSVDEE
jgi:hypothetical protein